MTMPQTQAIDYQALALALLQQQGAPARTKAVSSTPTVYYGHGNGGLFSFPGLNRQLFNATILPRLGLQSRLPYRPTNETNPLYGIVTGVTATTGSEPTGVCDDPPTAGLMKLCTHSFVFGRQARQTRPFDVDRIGLVTNRGEFQDLQIIGDPTRDNPNLPSIAGNNGLGGAINTEVGKALFELAVAWSRDFARETYTGNPSSNTSGGGRKYFYGLDSLINTGYRDTETGVACPAADSIIRSFGNVSVETQGGLLVRQITDMMRRLKSLAARTGLDPVKWVIAMRQELFYQISEVWPCAYATYRCRTDSNTFSTSQNEFTDSSAMLKMRDEMRGNYYEMTGQYLLIDGDRVEVVLDDAITETNSTNGSYLSDIYFVPLTVLGNTPVTFFEFVNYDMANGALAAARAFAADGQFYTTNGGRFLWHKKPPTNFCVQLLAKTEPRLLLLTPYLAARLTGLRYTPLSHDRDPFTDSSYFVNGGRVDRLGWGPSFFSPTA